MWKILKPKDVFPGEVPMIFTRAKVLPPFPEYGEETLEELYQKEDAYNTNEAENYFDDGEEHEDWNLPVDLLWYNNHWAYRCDGWWVSDGTLVETVNKDFCHDDRNSYPFAEIRDYTFAIWVEDKIYQNLPPTTPNNEAHVDIYL